MNSSANRVHRARGFSLVEVMVALIVISVGLLGCAKLGALLVSSTGTSRVRALVALEASSIADSMHADRDFWDGSSSDWNPTAALSITGTESAGTTTFSSSGSTTLTNGLTSPPNCLSGSGAPCTPGKLAAYDLTQWAKDIGLSTGSNVLKNSTTTINCASATPPSGTAVVTCTINIQWQENTVAANSQESTPTSFQTDNYQLVVQP